MSTGARSHGRPGHDGANANATASGFTLIELVVVMGILTGFLLMLAQMVDSGLRMFGEGELGQALADRASRAQRVIARELTALRGSATGRDRDVVDDRLVVQRLPVGLPPRPERNATRVQVLRGSVRLEPDRELPLLEAMVTARLQRNDPALGGGELAQRVQQALRETPLRGLGNMVLLPWRQEGDDDALLELRVGWLLPGQKLPVGPEREEDPFEVPVPGSPELPALLVHGMTVPILQDLLHVELLLWGQTTTTWGDGDPTGGASAGSGPFTVWDSARGGWLVDDANGGVFALDRGAGSASDPRDDVHPHAILVRCVVAQPADRAAEGLLVAHLDADATVAELANGDRFPGADTGGFVKIRGEWIGYAERDGDVLRGLRRGARSTKAIEHPSGTPVHVGRTVEFVVPIPHAKDDWNG
jgi:hypothetical protein